MNQIDKTYKTIGEVAKILNLVDKKTGKLSTHTIRYWEKEFKQIKPHIFSGRRRYYDNNTIETLKKIQFLLKVKGMTINGVKKLLIKDKSDLDVQYNNIINKKILKTKLNRISTLLKKINKNG